MNQSLLYSMQKLLADLATGILQEEIGEKFVPITDEMNRLRMDIEGCPLFPELFARVGKDLADSFERNAHVSTERKINALLVTSTISTIFWIAHGRGIRETAELEGLFEEEVEGE
jgi:hypothetical protein